VANDQVMSAQSKEVMARLENHLGVENGLVEPSPEVQSPEELHRQDPGPRPLKVPFEGRECYASQLEAHLAHCEPMTLVPPPDFEQPQV
jgi:hypothetical protein